MSSPMRLQLSRRKGFDLQTHSREVNGLPAVVVARPTRWGNPYRVGDDVINPGNFHRRKHGLTAAEAVAKFERRECGWTRSADIVRLLRGRNLACWCAPSAPCHADVLLGIANRPLCEAVP